MTVAFRYEKTAFTLQLVRNGQWAKRSLMLISLLTYYFVVFLWHILYYTLQGPLINSAAMVTLIMLPSCAQGSYLRHLHPLQTLLKSVGLCCVLECWSAPDGACASERACVCHRLCVEYGICVGEESLKWAMKHYVGDRRWWISKHSPDSVAQRLTSWAQKTFVSRLPFLSQGFMPHYLCLCGYSLLHLWT